MLQAAQVGAHRPPIQQQRPQQHAGQNQQQVDFFEEGPAENHGHDQQVVPTLAVNGRGAAEHEHYPGTGTSSTSLSMSDSTASRCPPWR